MNLFIQALQGTLFGYLGIDSTTILVNMTEIVSGARPERFELPTPWFVEKCPIPSMFIELKELT